MQLQLRRGIRRSRILLEILAAYKTVEYYINGGLKQLLLLLLKKVGNARLRESDIHPISPKTPAAQHQSIDRKKRKGKIVDDHSGYRAA